MRSWAILPALIAVASYSEAAPAQICESTNKLSLAYANGMRTPLSHARVQLHELRGRLGPRLPEVQVFPLLAYNAWEREIDTIHQLVTAWVQREGGKTPVFRTLLALVFN